MNTVQLGTFVLFFLYLTITCPEEQYVMILVSYTIYCQFNQIYVIYSKDISFSCIPYTTCLCMWYEIDDYTWLICGCKCVCLYVRVCKCVCLCVRVCQRDRSHKYKDQSKGFGKR